MVSIINLDSQACKICKAREMQRLNRIIWKKSCPSGREVAGVGLRPLACWDCGFESRCGNGYLSLVNVVCCQIEVSAMSSSLFQRTSWLWPTRCCCSVGEKEYERKTLLGSQRRRWEDNIKMDLQGAACEGNYRINLAQGKMAGSCEYVEGFHNTRKVSRPAELQ